MPNIVGQNKQPEPSYWLWEIVMGVFNILHYFIDNTIVLVADPI